MGNRAAGFDRELTQKRGKWKSGQRDKVRLPKSQLFWASLSLPLPSCFRVENTMASEGKKDDFTPQIDAAISSAEARAKVRRAAGVERLRARRATA